MHVCLDEVSGPVEWRVVHATPLKVTRARMEHSLHSKKALGPARTLPSRAQGLLEKGSCCCFDHLFESETNYGIKESGAEPGIQLINPHLLTETVVGPPSM